MAESHTTPKDVLARLTSDPEYVKRVLRSNELDTFKQEFGVVGSSKLRCPACSQFGQSGASLWWNPDNPTRFVCRKCKRVWQINLVESRGETILDVINEIRGK